MIYTLVVLVLTAVAFVIGKVRSDVVALLSLLALILGGIISPQEALSAFSNGINENYYEKEQNNEQEQPCKACENVVKWYQFKLR